MGHLQLIQWEKFQTTTHTRSSALRFFYKLNQHNLKEFELSLTLDDKSVGIILKIEQGDFPNNPEGNKLYEECFAGWNFVKDNLIIAVNELISIK